MLFEIIILFIFLSFIFLEVGTKTEYNFIFMLFSSVFLLIVGISIMATGIEIGAGSTITDIGGGVTNVVNNYTSLNDGFYRSTGLIFLGVGMYTFISGAMMFRDYRNRNKY